MIKDLPKTIYLQTGSPHPEIEDEISMNDLAEVTWCHHKIHENDACYVLQPTPSAHSVQGAEEIPYFTAEEFFNAPGGMFILDFLTSEEQETLYKAIELFALGRVRHALQDKGGWVKVEDGLPEPELMKNWDQMKDYLVANENGVKQHSYKFYEGGFWRKFDGDEFARRLNSVTHWQPLPEPPNQCPQTKDSLVNGI